MNTPNFLMQYFAYEHLPEHLQATSKAFATVAMHIDANHTESSEKEATLRKLLEAKDAAVRSRLYTNKMNEGSTTVVNSPDGCHHI